MSSEVSNCPDHNRLRRRHEAPSPTNPAKQLVQQDSTVQRMSLACLCSLYHNGMDNKQLPSIGIKQTATWEMQWSLSTEVSARVCDATLPPAADASSWWLSVDRTLSGVCGCLVTRRRRPRPLWLDAPLVFALDTTDLSPTAVFCGVDRFNCFLLLLAAVTTITTVFRNIITLYMPSVKSTHITVTALVTDASGTDRSSVCICCDCLHY